MENYAKLLANTITTYRKANAFTQEVLAEKLGVSFQAVSKWENEQSSPDIMMLPQLAEIFGISIDTLFGKGMVMKPHYDVVADLPWPSDETLRGVVYLGHKLLERSEELTDFTFNLNGPALNVVSHCNIACGVIQNGATAASDINCSTISGGAHAGCDVNCGGDISGGVNAGCDINLNGAISGGASAGGAIQVGDKITGTVTCKGDLTCHAVEGDVNCQGDMIYK